MCIRDRFGDLAEGVELRVGQEVGGGLVEAEGDEDEAFRACLLYTSDAADDLLCVDLGGRRIINKKNANESQLPPRSRQYRTSSNITHTTRTRQCAIH